MTISQNWLSAYLPAVASLTPDELSARLTSAGLEVEGFEQTQGAGGALLEIGLTPNRGDAASHRGVARDLSALLGQPIQEPMRELAAMGAHVGAGRPVKAQIATEAGAMAYGLIRIEGLRAGEMLGPPYSNWLAGLAGLQTVPVDLTQLLLFGEGQPAHAFDADKLVGDTLTVGLAGALGHAGKRFRLLGNLYVELHEEDLIIADAQSPVALAGVMGGADTAISEHTTNVVLELACFSPAMVRRTAARHGVRSEASFRFERGTDPLAPARLLDMAAQALVSLAGGESSRISAPSLVYGKPWQDESALSDDIKDGAGQPAARVITASAGRIAALIGADINQGRMTTILEALGFGVKQHGGDTLAVAVPSWRMHDCETIADLCEEVVRMIGLENLPMPESLTLPYLDSTPGWDDHDLEHRLASALAARGWQEAMTISMGPAEAMPAGAGEPIALLNPLSEALAVMRTHPLPGLVEAVAYNARRKARACRFFERAYSYHPGGPRHPDDPSADGATVHERGWLSLILWGQTAEGWQAKPRPYRMDDLLDACRAVATALGGTLEVEPVKLEEDQADPVALAGFVAGRALRLSLWPLAIPGTLSTEGTAMGRSGERVPMGIAGPLTEEMLAGQDLTGEAVWAACLPWPALMSASRALRPGVGARVRRPARLPAVRRDLSVVVDRAVTYEQLSALAWGAGVPELADVGLFDVFEGASLGEGRKAYALSFILQPNEATLTDTQTDERMATLERALHEGAGAIVRRSVL